MTVFVEMDPAGGGEPSTVMRVAFRPAVGHRRELSRESVPHRLDDTGLLSPFPASRVSRRVWWKWRGGSSRGR